MIWDFHSGSGSRILIFYPSRSRIQGSKRQWISDSDLQHWFQKCFFKHFYSHHIKQSFKSHLLRLHGTGQHTVKSQFCLMGDIGVEDQGGRGFEDNINEEERSQSPTLSSADEDDGDEESVNSYSQMQIRYSSC
jgi:hypothetical protein